MTTTKFNSRPHFVRATLVGILAASAPRGATAQAAAAISDSAPPVRKAWGSLALGPARVNGGDRIGADLAVWVTRNQRAWGFRFAAASRLFEPGDAYDLSVLAGIHPLTDPHADFVAGLGAGISRGHDNGGGNIRTIPALVAGANFTFNYRVVGIGVDGFATVGSQRFYYGGGLALALGWFN